MPKSRLLLQTAVFAISFSTLLFELSLTRIFSVLLWYHFVFVVVSISVLGLGIGAWLLYKTGLRRRLERSGPVELSRYALLLGLTAPLSVTGIILYPYPHFLAGYIFIILIPFIAAGLFLSGTFQYYGQEAQRLYFADLLGGGLGSLAVLPFLENFGAINTAMAIGLVPCLAALCLIQNERKNKALIGSAALVMAATVLFLLTGSQLLQDRFGFSYQANKTMFEMTDRGGYELVFSEWTAFARTDVFRSKDNPLAPKWIFTDGGAGSVMLPFDGDLRSMEPLQNDLSFFPFTWGDNEKVLIIGSGGGKDVLLALLGGARDITAVEINESIIKAVNELADFNGGIYMRDEVRVVRGDARNFVESDAGEYDLIYLPQVYTQAAGRVGHALAENYIFTTEAFSAYMERLAPGGRLAFVMHDIQDLTKALMVSFQVFQDRGVTPAEAARRIAVVHQPSNRQHIMNPVLILQDQPFTPAEIQKIAASTEQMGLTGFLIPGVIEPEFLNGLRTGRVSMAGLLSAIPVNVEPPTDDKPFFYNFEKGVPVSIRILLFMVGAIALASLLAFLGARRPAAAGGNSRWWTAVTFTGLGIGFMLIEIALIQKMILVFGNPVKAFAVILFMLLVSGGLGSLLASRFEPVNLPLLVTKASTVVVLFSLFYLWLLDQIVGALLAANDIAVIAAVALLTVPLGFFMGIPFSSSLRLLQEYEQGDIAAAWGINGITSVLGSVLAVTAAMLFGFSAVFMIGAVCYGAVAASSLHFYRTR